jgi:integrase
MIQTYLDNQAKYRSNNASNRDRKNLMAMWTFGRKILKLEDNPLMGIEKRSHERQPQYVPPVENILKVLLAATRMERLFLDCYLQTGARRSEIFRWTWVDDINFEQRKVRLGSRKSRDGAMKYRWIDMNDDLYKNLLWLWKNRKFKNSPYVWINDHPGPYYGKPYKYRRRFLPGLCKRAKVKSFGFHALRRFVASILQDSGKVSLKKIQLLLGHSNLATTERYIYHLGEDLKSTVEVLSEIKRHEDEARNEKEAKH